MFLSVLEMEHPMELQVITLKSVPISQFNDNFIVHQISGQRHKTSSLTNKLNYQHGIEYLKNRSLQSNDRSLT